MLDEADLDIAVTENILTTEQATALRAFALRRQRERMLAVGHEERFQFLRTFNDFFFAIGVALLGGGLVFFTFAMPAASLAAAVIIWALSELLVARMRLVLPGILLACFFVAFMALASPVDYWFSRSTQMPFDVTSLQEWFTGVRKSAPKVDTNVWSLIAMSYAGVAAAAALLFYARFRLPFTLLLFAGSLVSGALVAPFIVSEGFAAQSTPYILLCCGLAVFLGAMAFDASDRERVTRRADCAFWLHLLAAPLIVHSLIKLVWPSTVALPVAISVLNTAAVVSTALIIAVLATVAVIIDRRALLVSALSYLGVIIGYAINSAIKQQRYDNSFVFFATLLVLGVLVIALGVGWQPLRRALLLRMPSSIAGRLPPATAAAKA